MRICFPALVLLLTTNAAGAAALAVDDGGLSGGSRYERCIALTGENATRGLAAASEWERAGGGAGALHCQAIALSALHRYGEAATRLDAIGHGSSVNSAAERANILDQAGNAWILGGRPANAESSFSVALNLLPNDADILSDRARARGLRSNWTGAEADLSSALSRDANRADLLVLRASARHALGKKVEARADIDAALRIVSNYPEALLERGVMKYEAGDLTGAQSDWRLVLSSAPSSAAAKTARQHLDDMNAATAPTVNPAVKRSTPP